MFKLLKQPSRYKMKRYSLRYAYIWVRALLYTPVENKKTSASYKRPIKVTSCVAKVK